MFVVRTENSAGWLNVVTNHYKKFQLWYQVITPGHMLWDFCVEVCKKQLHYDSDYLVQVVLMGWEVTWSFKIPEE